MEKVSLFIKQNKNLLFVFGLIVLFGVLAPDVLADDAKGAATGGLQELNDAGGEGKTTVVNAIKGWKWVFGIMPFAVAIFVTYKVKDYLEQKDEQAGGQTEPKVSRYGKLLGAFIGGIIIMFLLYGVFGKVFAGHTEFRKGWDVFVIQFWKEVLN